MLTYPELKNAVQADLVGKLLTPHYPDFVPWEWVNVSRRSDPQKTQKMLRKIGTVLPDEREKYEQKIPVLVMEIIEGDQFRDLSYRASYSQSTPQPEIWIKCLWDNKIVYHRISESIYYLLKDMIRD